MKAFALQTSHAKRWLGSFLFLLGLVTCLVATLRRAFPPPGIALIFLVESAALALPLAWVAGLVRQKLVVGADGFTVRWLWQQRYVPFRDVTTIWHADPTYVKRGSGETLALQVADEEGAALYTELLDAFVRSHGTAEVGPRLRRGARSTRDWLRALDELARGGYRSAALTPDTLLAALEDPEPDVRLGAAMALVRLGDRAHRARIRVAADSCAQPEARRALLRIAAAETDREVEAALAPSARRR